MQEADPELDNKAKELFWILYTQAMKERPASRACYWIVFFASLVLSIITYSATWPKPYWKTPCLINFQPAPNGSRVVSHDLRIFISTQQASVVRYSFAPRLSDWTLMTDASSAASTAFRTEGHGYGHRPVSTRLACQGSGIGWSAWVRGALCRRSMNSFRCVGIDQGRRATGGHRHRLLHALTAIAARS
jgi:hypothetical protein